MKEELKMIRKFPEGFIWGVATASYQIEGSPLADGTGMSIWHTFSHTPGNIKNGDTGDIACDHYKRYKEDVELMKELGVKGYRFSISWPRIFPKGSGEINQKGLDFYNRLIDELLSKDIIPFITIYHWDLPFELQLKGGWANRDIADRFAEYSKVLFENFGDRVKHWITLNEPWVVAFVGHLFGIHAPGMKDIFVTFHVVHNLLRAHAKAVEVFRNTVTDGKIGITLNNTAVTPASDSPEDKLAAETMHQMNNYPLFLNPIFKGNYPDRVLENARQFLPENFEEDLPEIQKSIDFVGINYYSGSLVKYDPESPMMKIKVVPRDLPKTEMGWEIEPEGFYRILKGVHDEYSPKEIYVTENGAAFDDTVEDGKVHDENRIDYLRKHFEQALRAIEDGVRLKGYFVWSLLDNFEWAEGYSKRFGLVYVDYPTQGRILKDSAKWYKDVIKNNGF
jgi:beta-glucosidase